jgi:preprotein translocase subunit YajC
VELFILLLLMLGVFWFFVITPQRRRQAQHNSMVDNLKPGDYIVTAGGMYGTVTDLGDDDLGLEVAPDVEVRVAKRAVGALIPPEEIEDVEVDEQGVPLEGDAVAQQTDAADPEPQPVEENRR